ncbi:MAG TPA: DUF3108 domain-containing protein [Burkholderiales bacterium]|nr:DUF3108 domain-containing protein [Burkholderiales bacterium]
MIAHRDLIVRILAAIVLSLLVHTVVLFTLKIRAPREVEVPPPLTAQLAPLPPKPAVTAAPPPLPQPQPEAKPVPQSRPASEPAAKSQPHPPRHKPQPQHRAAAAPHKRATPPVIAVPHGASRETVPPPAAAAPSAPAATATPAAPYPGPVRQLPVQSRITYDLYLGSDRFLVGRTIQDWKVNGSRYQLTSVAQTVGLAAVIRYRLSYTSHGTVTSHGLRPQSFDFVRERRSDIEQAHAQFDWQRMTITLGTPDKRRTIPLKRGAQDLMSFAWQLAQMPLKPGVIHMPITNGKNLDNYALKIGAHETVKTPLGDIDTIPVRQVPAPGEESLEVWLAPQYRYLPVKVQFFGRDGELSGEQLITDVQVSGK